MNIITMRDVCKNYFIGSPNELRVLKNMSLDVAEGEFLAIVGQSGSGKSTLMNIVGALDRPTTGSYVLAGDRVDSLDDRALSHVRNQKIGFVFQTFNLIGRSSALANVELPLFYAGISPSERRRRALELLDLVGMSDRVSHYPNELSGGQKQRVAIARALANDPAILLADEPTGALDSATGDMVMELFQKIHRQGKTILFITHSGELAERCQRIVSIRDGEIVSDSKGAKLTA